MNPARHLIALVALAASTAMAQIIPEPVNLQIADGTSFTGNSILCETREFEACAKAFASALERLGVAGATTTSDPDAGAPITLLQDSSLGVSAYRISDTGDGLVLSAKTPAGIAHGTASLLQTVTIRDGEASWPKLRIEDEPAFPFRGFMIDMGRNPHSPELLRQVIDTMWFFKANYLHLHLTDDQLFSWPSKAYPKLYSERAGWDWDDFVALEEYAAARGVVLIPEVDVPGHSTILRKQYPEVFGETASDLATSPEAQRGVETLIEEFISVFQSSPYIHIGGDEAGGVSEEDQRDFINRLNRFIRSKGKQTLVWEGPRLGKGENKVDEDVIHINWRTINFRAQDMLDAGYQVVNAAWDPLYIVDHYPRTMFTAVDVERCYHWDPQRFAHVNHGMPTFANPHRTKTPEGIIGFCMPWWEGRGPNLLPLCVPRLAATTSAAWNRRGETDFSDFQDRLASVLPTLQKLSGFELPETPFADPASQADNLAFRGKVTPSSGASQPHFGPDRLTNGIPDRFDHFLGFPTQPD
ncbi:MAG: family 20 glycosylhydrolase, partial [Verrucomicrobiales bacterium]